MSNEVSRFIVEHSSEVLLLRTEKKDQLVESPMAKLFICVTIFNL